MNLNITYIYHDCFIISLNDRVILFDYSEILSEKQKQIVINKIKNKNLIVLITHSHRDHFSKDAFSLSNYVKDFKCIVSEDVLKLCGECAELCKVVKEGDTTNIDNVHIRVYGSSDPGVSYLIKVKKVKIYFSGDNTDWRRASLPEEFNKTIKNSFEAVINKLKRNEEHVDILFANLCAECESYGGIDILCNVLKPRFLIPMHLSGNVKILKTYSDFLKKLATNIFIYEKSGDTMRVEF